MTLSDFSPAWGQPHSTVRSDEVVLFFPTAANLSDDAAHWLVPVQGVIFEPEENDLLRTVILRGLREEMGDLANAEQSAIFQQRLRLFLVDNERNKRIGVRIAGSEHTLPPSAADGYFSDSISLPAADLETQLDSRQLTFAAILRKSDPREFVGTVYCLPPTGVSVISDIDDTIKVSNVQNRRELILNTFARDFEPVAGMAKVYRKWADAGAAFHYVTASPWQLYRPLDEFLRTSDFPAGSIQMKRVRLKDNSIRELLADPFDYKVATIGSLIERFPQRTFILVGDSGERDPEVFAQLLRRHPDQIAMALLRDVTNEAADAQRYRDTFHNLPKEKWQLFRDPATLSLPAAAIFN